MSYNTFNPLCDRRAFSREHSAETAADERSRKRERPLSQHGRQCLLTTDYLFSRCKGGNRSPLMPSGSLNSEINGVRFAYFRDYFDSLGVLWLGNPTLGGIRSGFRAPLHVLSGE
jgi:hypothetical protein